MDELSQVYLNHAGTSWPKPKCVVDAAAAVLSSDPNEWPALFRDARQTIADFFHVERSRLVLTPSCTGALSLAVSDHAWLAGDRVLTSGYEHHALGRALTKLSEFGVDVKSLPHGASELVDLDALRSELGKGRVKMLALTAACNVTGELLPICDTIELAHDHGALVLIDGAQIAGWWDLDLSDLNADLFTFAGHKGPHAPWGIGGLYVAPHVSMNCPLATCERADTQAAMICAPMPGYCDAGSVNLVALAGMAAATSWLRETEQQDRLQKARGLASAFAESIREYPGLHVYGDVPIEKKMPTVAITIDGRPSIEVANDLREQGFITSGGFQCAPAAHHSLGTSQLGVVRFSFGPANQDDDVERANQILQRVFV